MPAVTETFSTKATAQEREPRSRIAGANRGPGPRGRQAAARWRRRRFRGGRARRRRLVAAWRGCPSALRPKSVRSVLAMTEGAEEHAAAEHDEELASFAGEERAEARRGTQTVGEAAVEDVVADEGGERRRRSGRTPPTPRVPHVVRGHGGIPRARDPPRPRRCRRRPRWRGRCRRRPSRAWTRGRHGGRSRPRDARDV